MPFARLLCYNPHLNFAYRIARRPRLLDFCFKSFCVVLVLLLGGFSVFGQNTPVNRVDPKEEKKRAANSKDVLKNITAEQVVEASIIIYAYPGGRDKMVQIRKTEFERGKLTSTAADGKVTNANYLRWSSRGEPGKDRFRLDQELPTATYAMVQNQDKVFGIYNDSVFQPREDATVAFRNRIAHSIDSLLWYKENGSKIELAGREKILGVEFHLIDLTDKKDRKTRYYVSAKSFRVMMLEYEDAGVKYMRKFRDYKYAQGVLVPFNSELRSGDKILEEVHVGTVTFGQKLDETLFASAS